MTRTVEVKVRVAVNGDTEVECEINAMRLVRNKLEDWNHFVDADEAVVVDE